MNNSKCINYVNRDNSVFARCQHISYFPLVVTGSDGDYIVDADGNRFVDFLSSASALNLGNNFSNIEKAIVEQTKECIQYTSAYTYNIPMIEYAERLLSVYPGKIKAKVWFGNSGSDASDAAIKFSRAYTKRSKIITFVNSYHGSTYGSASLSDCTSLMHDNIGPLLPDIFHFQFWGERNRMDGNVDYLYEIKEAFKTNLNPYEVAAVIIEPMQGDGGMNMALPEFIVPLAELCKKYGILFITDEVQQAFFRNHHWFSIENFGIVPDGIILGKTIGGGIPLSAFIGKSEILDSLPPTALNFTLSGSPLACRAGIAQFDYMCSEEFHSILHRNEMLLKQELNDLLCDKFDIVDSVLGSGMSYGIYIVDKSNRIPDRKNTFKIVYRCYEYGLLVLSLFGNVIRIQPPLNIQPESLEKGFTILKRAIKDVEAGLVPDDVLDCNRGWSAV